MDITQNYASILVSYNKDQYRKLGTLLTSSYAPTYHFSFAFSRVGWWCFDLFR